MNKPHHIIRSQTLELSLNDEKSARDLQEYVSDVYKARVVPMMEDLFDKLVPDEQILKIESLELDLGELSEHQLHEELPARIEKALEDEIRNVFHKTNQGFTSEGSSEIHDHLQTQLIVFEFLLRSGAHPWNSPFKKQSLSSLFSGLLAKDAEKLGKLLQKEIGNGYVRKRLIYQLDDQKLHQLVALITDSSKSAYQSLLKGLLKASEELSVKTLSHNTVRYHIVENLLQTIGHQVGRSVTFMKTVEMVLSNLVTSLNNELSRKTKNDRYTGKWYLLKQVEKALSTNSVATSFGKTTVDVRAMVSKLIERESQNIETIHSSDQRKKAADITGISDQPIPDTEKTIVTEEIKKQEKQTLADRAKDEVNKIADLEKDKEEVAGVMEGEPASSKKERPKEKPDRKKLAEKERSDFKSSSDKFIQNEIEDGNEQPDSVEEPVTQSTAEKRKDLPQNIETGTSSGKIEKERITSEKAQLGQSQNSTPDSSSPDVEQREGEIHHKSMNKPAIESNEEEKTTDLPGSKGVQKNQPDDLANGYGNRIIDHPDESDFVAPPWRKPPEIIEEAFINNAGLALLWPYLAILFKGMGWVKDNVFVSEEYQFRAVHFLQFLVTGETATEEQELVFNKLLVGLEAESPIPYDVEITKEEIEEAEHLLETVLENWKALKSNSIEMLRTSFLQKEGILKKDMASWKLYVERSTFDILLDRLPWGYSVVKLPWMNNLINVEW